MKSNSTEMSFRRHTSERYESRYHSERRDERTYASRDERTYASRDERTYASRDADRSEYRRSEERKRYSKDYRTLNKRGPKEFRRDTKDYKSIKQDRGYYRMSPSVTRREGMHRNSPVELVMKGCRNTDSSSSDSDSNCLDCKNYNGRYGKRKHREESYEELSRKKRQIESELNALLEEEKAENIRMREEKKKVTRNHEHHERKADISRIPHSIKQERISDDERGYRNNRTNSPKRSGEKTEWGKRNMSDTKKPVKEKEKEKPNFGLSGKLTEDTNTFNGVVIKYNEPKEARKPKRRWRLYPFKGTKSLDFIPIHRQSAYLLGRSRLIADIPIDHPSCSKQHAVLQYRLTEYKRDDGTTGKRLRLYIIDLESSNGTFVNNQKVEPRRYVELLEKDVIKFGFSTREYVILHEQSKDESLDDDIIEENI